jgi:uncharacterized protein
MSGETAHRVVIDTNVFVSSFFGGNPRDVIDLWKRGTFIICLSQEIVEEYLNVLSRLGVPGKGDMEQLVKLFAEGHHCLYASKTPRLAIVKDDPDDDKFLECAVALDCKIIISGDKHLLAIEKYFDIEIMSPREFLGRFAGK